MRRKGRLGEATFSGLTIFGIQRVQTHSPLLRQSAHLAVAASCHAGLAVVTAWYVVVTIGVNFQSDAFFARRRVNLDLSNWRPVRESNPCRRRERAVS